MHTEPLIRAEIRRQVEQICASPIERDITVVTFDPKVDPKRPVSAVTKESIKVVEFAKQHKMAIAIGRRKVGAHSVTVVNRLTCPLEVAADILGGDTMTRIEAGRRQREALSTLDLDDEQYAAFMKATKKLDAATVDGIILIARYIREHPGLNIHQRTVRLPGIDTKFVERYKTMIEMLLNDGEFKLKDHRSVEIIVCYRDPKHLKNASRMCDVIIPGYSDTPFEYVPKAIVVCENKHSAMYMYPRDGLITMMGVGYSAATRILTELRISNHPHLIYWGDIDLEGMAILANVRKAGVKIRSICMDAHTAKKYAAYDVIPSHKSQVKLDPLFLTAEERGALKMLESGRIHRIEQEKLPENYVNHRLDIALGVVTKK